MKENKTNSSSASWMVFLLCSLMVIALCSTAVGNGVGSTITPYVTNMWFNGEEGLYFTMSTIVIICSILGSILLFISRSEVYKEVTNSLENCFSMRFYTQVKITPYFTLKF